MKKILSLTLAALMVVSMVPTAFAAEAGGNWAGGTAVDVTGEKTVVAADGSETHNAEYTLTVPAKLAPGASGTVTLDGYWPSDATVKVTADAKVNMVHSINSINTRDLVVTFDGIEKAGVDFGSQTVNANVAVAAMPEGAMFGTWHGVFNYMIEYNGEAAGTVIPDPEQPSNPDDGDDDPVVLNGSATFSDGVTLSWDELQLEENAAKYGYTLPLTKTDSRDGKLGLTYAFKGNKNITSIIIPDGIERIGQDAFIITATNQFTNVTIPTSVTDIDFNAFSSNVAVTYNYCGTQEQWNAINISDYAFGSYPKGTVICTDGTITIS